MNRSIIAAIVTLLIAFIAPQKSFAAELVAPAVVFADQPFPITLETTPNETATRIRIGDVYTGIESGADVLLEVKAPTRAGVIEIILEGENGAVLARTKSSVIPAYASLAPPVVAIVIALLLRSVLPALFLGIWSGAWLIAGLSPSGLWAGFLDSFQRYTVTAMTDPDHIAVILFTLMMGGMVAMITRNGGMKGVVNLLMRFAKGPRGGQVTITSLGFLIFFDDIANTLLIGNTMRPVADKLRISREKLAYLVDSTAAPLASIALATTWIGYEVSLIAAAQKDLPGFTEPPYYVFLNSLAYSFYPILALLLVWVIALTGRDFGPMLSAEQRARRSHPKNQPDEATVSETAPEPGARPKPRSLNALIPILILISALIASLYVTGEGETLRDRIGTADSFKALMWASMLGATSAGVMSMVGAGMSLEDTIEAWHDGLKTTLFAMLVLVLSWAISDITQILNTADFLISLLGDALPIAFVPAAAFLLSAVVAFTTGTSWGTMGIMLPLILPLAWGIVEINDAASIQSHMHIIYASIAAVLTGATFGDHCSPISDTTVLSSLASGCDHIEHVRTQIPYAMLAALLAVFVCAIPIGFGVAWWICLPLACVFLVIIVRSIGRRAG